MLSSDDEVINTTMIGKECSGKFHSITAQVGRFYTFSVLLGWKKNHKQSRSRDVKVHLLQNLTGQLCLAQGYAEVFLSQVRKLCKDYQILWSVFECKTDWPLSSLAAVLQSRNDQSYQHYLPQEWGTVVLIFMSPFFSLFHIQGWGFRHHTKLLDHHW